MNKITLNALHGNIFKAELFIQDETPVIIKF